MNARLTRMERALQKMCANCEHKKTDVTTIPPEERKTIINEMLFRMLPDTAAYEQWRADYVKSIDG